MIGSSLAVWTVIVLLTHPSDDEPPNNEHSSNATVHDEAGAGLEGRAPADDPTPIDATNSRPEPIEEVPPADRRFVQGTVVDETGRPIADVAIRGGLPPKPLSGPDDAPVIAHSRGNGGFEGWTEKNGWIYVADTDAWIGGEPQGTSPGKRFVFRLRATTLLRGTVIGAGGGPLADVRVAAEWNEGPKRRSQWAKSGPRGAFTLRVPRVQRRVTVWALPPRGGLGVDVDPRGSALVRIVVDPARDNPVTLRFDEGASLSGEVVRPDGTPITAGKVTATPLDWAPIVGHWTLLDGGNDFRLSNMPSGRYLLKFGNHREDEFACVPMVVQAPQIGIRVVCRKTHEVRGTVIGPTSGPLMIRCYHRDETSGAYYEWDEAEVVSGKFLFLRIPTGTFAFEARNSRNDLCAWIEDVSIPGAALVIEPKKGLRISGRMELPDDVPKRYPHVFARRNGISYYGTADGRGGFSIPGLQPGDYALHWTAGSATGPFDTNGPVEAGTEDVALRVEVE